MCSLYIYSILTIKQILNVKYSTILILILLLLGCTNIRDQESLKFYNGLLYDTTTGKPYTGKVYSLYSNGMKMRDGNFELGALDGQYTFYNKLGEIIEPIQENQLIYKNGR